MRKWVPFLLILAGCTPQAAPRMAPALDMSSPRTLVYHVDRNFQGDRSMWLEEAVWRLERDTHGRLRVELRFDLDWTERIQRFELHEWYLVDLPEDSGITEHFDTKHGTKILGECDADYHVVYLVTERVATRVRFVHTMMHESLHAVGLPHIPDPTAIMAAVVVPNLPLDMAPADLDAFCAVLRCPVKEVRP